MKLTDQKGFDLIAVVPHEGTWIEIRTVRYQRIQRSVVPHEGTWIEIEASVQIPLYGYVVPLEGKWIEILSLR